MRKNKSKNKTSRVSEVRLLTSTQTDPRQTLASDLGALAEAQVSADVALVQATTNLWAATKAHESAVASKTKAERAYASVRAKLSISLGTTGSK